MEGVKVPAAIEAPLVAMLGRPTANDVFGNSLSPIMMLALPQLEEITGGVFSWIVPADPIGPDDIREGTIIFAELVPDYQPETGERIVVQLTEGGSSNAEQAHSYDLVHYGKSDRGFEWFTRSEVSEGRVRLSETRPIPSGGREGIRIIGPYIASLRWESRFRQLLERMADDKIF